MNNDAAVMSKTERKARILDLCTNIEANKKSVKKSLKGYEKVAKNLKKAADELAAAETKYNKKASPKNTVKYEEAKDALVLAGNEYKDVDTTVNGFIADVDADYIKLADLYDGKKAAKIQKEADKYSAEIAKVIAKLTKCTQNIELDVATEEEVAALQIEQVTEVRLAFEVGDDVTVTGGLFAGYNGTVQAISEDMKNVTVLIKRGNRDMPVELATDEVKLLAAQN